MPESLGAAMVWLIPGCPLLAAIVIALFGRLFRAGGYRVAVAALTVSALLALVQLGHVIADARHAPSDVASSAAAVERSGPIVRGFEWVSTGGFHVRVDAQIDALSAVMLAMVTFVSLLVMIYAGGYMHGDAGVARFFAEMSLFVFSMCMLVMARNFVILFVFWEAVGLCSYLLIGFWFDRPSASAAAVKAFVMNRIGDAAFLIALFLIWRTFNSFDFADVFAGAAAPGHGLDFGNRMFEICLCLFIGACGKSAQFPLHLWLPDAMEGPTPVSALIHAATMVTAGVYLVARCTPLFVLAPAVQALVAAIGGFTALLAALIALTQTDLKRVMAYSTVSQLGYMFLALGSAAADRKLAAAAVTAAMFHMFTHAFFKALLFLSSGNVMHAMGNVIDMRRFGGLKTILPVTNAVFLCGALALSGFPILSGFWSKDDIFGVVNRATQTGPYTSLFQVLFPVAFATAALTAFYTFRAYYLTFSGPTRVPDEAFAHAEGAHGHSSDGQVSPSAAPAAHAVPGARDPHDIHEGPAVMKWPLMVLSLFALGVGLAVGPTHVFAGWIEETPTLVPGNELPFNWGMAGASGLIVIGGIGLAAAMYARPNNLPQRVRELTGPLYTLSYNKFYLDELATGLVTFPVNAIAFLSLVADQGLIDRFVDWLGAIPSRFGSVLRPIQSGLIQSYALVMLFGLAAFLAIQFWMVRIP